MKSYFDGLVDLEITSVLDMKFLKAFNFQFFRKKWKKQFV